MSDLERYQSPVIEQRLANFETPTESDSHSTSNMIMGVLRRWYIVLPVFFVMCGIGIPAIWFSIEPLYSVTGAVRVDPIIKDIETGETDRGEISNYSNFINTEAALITSGRVVQRVADNLTDRNLAIFQNRPAGIVAKAKQTLMSTKTKPEPASILKKLTTNGVISAAADRSTELIKITMKSTNAEEAKTIIDDFISAYMAVEVTRSSESEGQTLRLLKDEYNKLTRDKQVLFDQINKLSQEFGSVSPTTFDALQGIKWNSLGITLNNLEEWKNNKIRIQNEVDHLKDQLASLNSNAEGQTIKQEKLAAEAERTVDPNNLARIIHINNDPLLRIYNSDLARSEQELISAKDRLQPGNPELQEKIRAVEELKALIEKHRIKVGREYDYSITQKTAEEGKEKLLNAKDELADKQAELKLTIRLVQEFSDKLEKEEKEIIDMGLLQLRIEELKEVLALTKKRFKRISGRTEELEFEQNRPERISVAYNAEIGPIQDKRVKYTMALMFGSMACGMMLAFLRDKADLRLRTPDDVVKRIGIRIIGTTTGSDTIKKALFPRQIAGDYQTIRANLRLLNGDKEPKMLVIASPGMREGKTTFAINLATSMSKSGKKVLLIDGDLRKPDIAYLLNLPRGSRGLQDLLFGRKKYHQAVYSVPATGLDVLAADSRNRDDACELLAMPGARERIKTISQTYDHVIIDTPPVLAFPDALVWAKMADAVILTSFAYRTTAPDLREATEKLAQINANVLGIVLSNVSAGNSYYRYGHNYYEQSARSRKNTKQAAAKLLLPAKPKS